MGQPVNLGGEKTALRVSLGADVIVEVGKCTATLDGAVPGI